MIGENGNGHAWEEAQEESPLGASERSAKQKERSFVRLGSSSESTHQGKSVVGDGLAAGRIKRR